MSDKAFNVLKNVSTDVPTKTLMDEDIEILASSLENFLQDSLQVCPNDCCEDMYSDDALIELARKIVNVLVATGPATVVDVDALSAKLVQQAEIIDELKKRLYSSPTLEEFKARSYENIKKSNPSHHSHKEQMHYGK